MRAAGGGGEAMGLPAASPDQAANTPSVPTLLPPPRLLAWEGPQPFWLLVC